MPKKAPEWLNADIQEFYPTCQGNIRAIQRAIQEKRGQEIAYMTITERMKRLGLERPRDKAKQAKTDKSPAQEAPMIEPPVEVLPGEMSIEDADTAGEVHYGAVQEYDALPDGYAKVIQPMRPYSDAEEFALNESMRLFGFVGAIVRDQYGRILDGNQRQRVARLRGLSVPHTITHVRDDAHATAIATSLNAVRRQYPRAEREQLALVMRDHDFSYRVIAAALGVSKDTVQRDILGNFQIIPAPEPEAAIVSSETIPRDTHETTVSSETISRTGHEMGSEIVSSETIPAMEPTPAQTPEPVKRVQRKGGGTYPAQRPTPRREKPVADRVKQADEWQDRFWSHFRNFEQLVERFKQAGGVLVLVRDWDVDAQRQLLDSFRQQSKTLQEMAAHFEKTIIGEESALNALEHPPGQ